MRIINTLRAVGNGTKELKTESECHSCFLERNLTSSPTSVSIGLDEMRVNKALKRLNSSKFNTLAKSKFIL